MKTKKLTPRNVAVQRENTASISRSSNAIAPSTGSIQWALGWADPFAGDDAE